MRQYPTILVDIIINNDLPITECLIKLLQSLFNNWTPLYPNTNYTSEEQKENVIIKITINVNGRYTINNNEINNLNQFVSTKFQNNNNNKIQMFLVDANHIISHSQYNQITDKEITQMNPTKLAQS